MSLTNSSSNIAESFLGWQFCGKSRRGASHLRSGTPNQDAHLMEALPDGESVLMAVSDGHGSSKCFRSDKGSRFAVEAAAMILKSRFASAQRTAAGQAQFKQLMTERLSEDCIRHWRNKVDQDLHFSPFSEEDWARLADKGEAGIRQSVEENPHLAYGATLLAVLINPKFVLYFQLGDGDIVVVSSTGEAQRPFPQDKRLIANETFSLCLPEAKAIRETRVVLQILEGRPPQQISIATDGVANSYEKDTDFLQFSTDILAIAGEYGPSFVEENLAKWLDETSAGGSGDDVTMTIAIRGDALCTASTVSPLTQELISFPSSVPLADSEQASIAHVSILQASDLPPDSSDITFSVPISPLDADSSVSSEEDQEASPARVFSNPEQANPPTSQERTTEKNVASTLNAEDSNFQDSQALPEDTGLIENHIAGKPVEVPRFESKQRPDASKPIAQAVPEEDLGIQPDKPTDDSPASVLTDDAKNRQTSSFSRLPILIGTGLLVALIGGAYLYVRSSEFQNSSVVITQEAEGTQPEFVASPTLQQ